MAVIKGVKEKVHLPLYDSIFVKAGKRLGEIQSSNVLRFFQDVTGKTKLQTNMQASSLLPHWNTFEARALRVVLSDLAAQFPAKPTADLTVECALNKGQDIVDGATVTLTSLTLSNFVQLSRRLEASEDQRLLISRQDAKALSTADNTVGFKASDEPDPKGSKSAVRFAEVGLGDLRTLGDSLAQAGANLPPAEQTVPHNGAGNLISRFIYNSVTSFFVGEKVMIQVPTWFFPSGAGPYAEDGRITTHGYPSPQATFRFAEPIHIDTQQNFRVEIEIPENDVLSDFQKVYGPLFIWVVVDGYMTRDVQ